MCTNGNSYNSRIETLDIYKGLLIFLVVWGHFMMPLIDREYPVARRLFLLIYSFHMPAFIFLSGYFYYGSWKKRGIVFKSICSWIVLYCVMKLMLNCSDILFYGEKKLIPNFLHESYAPWYILVMIIFKLLLLPIEFIQKINKKDTETNNQNIMKGKADMPKELFSDGISIYLMFLIVLSACLSMLNMPWQEKVGDFLALDRVVSFAPFFYMGMLYKKYLSSGRVSVFEKTNKPLFITGAVFVGTFIIFFSIIGPYTRMFYGTWGYILVYENMASIFKGVLNPLRVVFIPYALCIAYFFFVLINKKEFFLTPFLKKFGVYSLPIYVFHRPIRDAFSYYVLNKVSFGRFEEEILIIIMAILSFVCCYVLGNRFTDRVCRPF
ncbi:acyltransferase [Lachnoanaerobaculum orale]|uniref:Acyltransferase n=1 Tax=Lachnoanaerobaculum orale TaxID=979627 RepID=A0A3P3Q632_9FIRM|nr:acyltransferase [Lachnoanaerobaculum orale]RRJ16672.1 acyltransferase [Lachnoanaerobaculum orale]